MGLPSICVAIPTWNREAMLLKSLNSLLWQDYEGLIHITITDDASTDNTRAILLDLKSECLRDKYVGPRAIQIINGPGRSNWRPGAIHWPVFNAWLSTSADLITYQFSDEWSSPERFRLQVQEMEKLRVNWSYCKSVAWVNADGGMTHTKMYNWDPSLIPSNHLMTPTLLLKRNVFFEKGGLDFPIHSAAKAEEWIITHASFMGAPAPVSNPNLYFFRVHEQSLGHGQKPGSDTYKESTEITGFYEQGHWDLWNKIGGIYDQRILEWRQRNGSR